MPALKQIQPTRQQLGSQLMKCGFPVLLAFMLGVFLSAESAEAQVPPQEPIIERPFAPRFTTGVQGNISITSNTLMTCQGGCAAQNSLTLNNAAFNMVYVDVDGDATTFNSSGATLNLPPGATVLWAGLYWGAYAQTPDPTAASPEAQVRFKTPGSATYANLRATQFDYSARLIPDPLPRQPYQGFVEVTQLVQAAGNGQYFVANVRAQTNARNRYAGWALIVVYQDRTQRFRSLSVIDGFAVVITPTEGVRKTLNIPLTNFLTPPSGPFDAFVSSIVYEGDGGIPGDNFEINGVALSNSDNPANDFFNGSISSPTAALRNPNFRNQLGVDIDLVNANASGLVIPNNVRSAIATFSTTSPDEAYFPGAFTSGIESVLLSIAKTAPASIVAGNNLQYTITVTNNGPAIAENVRVTDPTPTGLTLVSTTSTPTSNGISCNTLNPCNLGELQPGEVVTITTTYAVPSNYTEPNPITNTASVTSDNDVEIRTATTTTVVESAENPRLGVAKQVTNVVNNGNGTYDVTYEVRVRNEGGVLLNNLQLTEDLTPTYDITPFILVSPPTSSNLTINPNFNGNSDTNLLAGTDTLPVGETRTLTFTVRITPGTNLGPYNNTVRGNAVSPNGTPVSDDSADGANPDPNNDGNSNNDASPTSVNFIETPRLGVAKGVTSVVNNNNGTFDVKYTVTVRNYGGVVLNNLQLTENLRATFGETPFSVVSSPTSNSLSINPNFNGSSDTNLLVGTDALRPSQVATIIFTVRVTPGTEPVTYNNIVQGTGTTPGGQTTTDTADNSVDGPDPDPDNDGNPQNNTSSTPVTLPVATEPPRLRLVKRITNATRNGTPVSGVDFSRVVDDTEPNDNAPSWPTNFLLGVPQLGDQTLLQSGDEVEYTIYFLADGGQPVRNFRFCDPIPAETIFVRNSFGADAGILLNRSGSVQARTNVLDGDEGAFFSPLASLPAGNACPIPTNPHGGVIVNLDEISNTAGSSFGFIRFRVQIQ